MVLFVSAELGQLIAKDSRESFTDSRPPGGTPVGFKALFFKWDLAKARKTPPTGRQREKEAQK